MQKLQNSRIGTEPTVRELEQIEIEEMQEDLALREQYANQLVPVDDDECDEVDEDIIESEVISFDEVNEDQL